MGDRHCTLPYALCPMPYGRSGKGGVGEMQCKEERKAVQGRLISPSIRPSVLRACKCDSVHHGMYGDRDCSAVRHVQHVFMQASQQPASQPACTMYMDGWMVAGCSGRLSGHACNPCKRSCCALGESSHPPSPDQQPGTPSIRGSSPSALSMESTLQRMSTYIHTVTSRCITLLHALTNGTALTSANAMHALR